MRPLPDPRATPLRLGIDLGGTKVEGLLLRQPHDHVFEELLRIRVPTDRERGYDAVIETVASLVERIAREAAIDLDDVPLGVGMPGGLRRDGCVKNSNTTCLNGRAFRSDLQARLGREMRFDNDANCFALAEANYGAGRAWREGLVFGVIVGTGVGGGLVMGGNVWSGPHGIAGEWGHHAVYASAPEDAATAHRGCYCGKTGCVEAYVSGPAVEADYLRRSGRAASMIEIAAAARSDPHARAACEVLVDAFARGLANVVNIVDPSVIVVGGGLSNVGLLLEEGRKRMAEFVFDEDLTTPVLRHELGDSAGVLGAALVGSGR